MPAADDAAVFWALVRSRAIASTHDFFMPIVDDALILGAIRCEPMPISDHLCHGRASPMRRLLFWVADHRLPAALAGQVDRWRRRRVHCVRNAIGWGASIDAPEPIIWPAVTGQLKSAAN